jgi:hypothetical protein
MSGLIFISYRREDGYFARRIHDQLLVCFPGRIFMDAEAREDFVEWITKTIANSCAALIVMIGPHWLGAAVRDGSLVRLEVSTALKSGIPVIPVLVDGAEMPREIQLPTELQPLVRYQAIEIRSNSFKTDSELLIHALNRLISTGNDVFISCKNLNEDGAPTRDADLATEVYNFLTVKGLRVFLSAFTLEQLGSDDYTRAIEAALDSASVLLAIGTSADHLNSKWVRYEWGSFANDIRSGRKPDGRLFTYIERMPITTLPRALRETQTIVHGQGSQERLYNFINNALPPSAEKRERAEKERLEAQEREKKPPQAKTPPTKTTTQTWIRKLDKLSWLPFAAVVLIRVYFLVILPLNASALQRFSIWLALLVFGILPSIVIASSFFNYPKRRILEASISVVCIVGVVLEYWGVMPVNIPVVIMILLLVIGAAIKIGLLLDSQTNKT